MAPLEPVESDSTHRRLAKPALGILLIAIAAAAVVVGIARQGPRPAPAHAATTEEAPQAVTVYYFHGDERCETCLAIEAATERTIRERFAEALAEGTLRYRAVNYDTPADRHFRDDFDLAFGSVVVQGTGPQARWENLADVWTLIHEEPAAFEAYLLEHITPMLPAGNR